MNKRCFFLVWAPITIIMGLSGSYNWYVGFASVILIVAFLFIGYLFLPKIQRDIPSAIVAFAAGLSSALFLWTVSSYLFKNTVVGSLLIMMIAAWGAYKFDKLSNFNIKNSEQKHLLIIVLIGLFMFLYLGGAFQPNSEGAVFIHRFGDWFAHLYQVGLIRTHGLPIPNYPIAHLGAPTIIAGISDISRLEPHQAAIVISLISFLVLPLASWFLTAEFSLPIWLRYVASLSPLIWGSLGLPLAIWQQDTALALDPLGRGFGSPAGAMYHNFPQLLSVSLVAVFVLGYNYSCTLKSKPLFIASCLALFASGLIKPSGIIVFGPALLIVLVINKEQRTNLKLFLAGTLLFCCVYFMPVLISVPVSSVETWAFLAGRWLDASPLQSIFILTGVAIIPLGLLLRQTTKALFAKQPYQFPPWEQVTAIAVFGSILFFMCFVEISRPGHGNNSWSLAGALTILAPQVIARLYKDMEDSRPFKSCFLFLAFLHLVSGGLYVSNYPLISKRWLQNQMACEFMDGLGFARQGIRLNNKCYGPFIMISSRQDP